MARTRMSHDNWNNRFGFWINCNTCPTGTYRKYTIYHFAKAMHIYVSTLGHQWPRLWLVAFLVPNHLMNQWKILIGSQGTYLLIHHPHCQIYASVNRVACSLSSHYLNLCWLIVNLSVKNKFQCNWNWNSIIPINENAFGNCAHNVLASMCQYFIQNLGKHEIFLSIQTPLWPNIHNSFEQNIITVHNSIIDNEGWMELCLSVILLKNVDL